MNMEPTSYRFRFQAYSHLHTLERKKRKVHESVYLPPLAQVDSWLNTSHPKVHKIILEPKGH